MTFDPKQIKSIAFSAGFDLCGTAPCRMLSEYRDFYDRWLSENMHSGLNYLSDNIDRRFDPRLIINDAKTVLICGLNYKNEAFVRQKEHKGPKIASYAFCADYHDVIKKMLWEVILHIRSIDPGINAKPFVDTAPILEKAWAVEAGLGWIGKNTLLITPEYGSTVLLGGIILSCELNSYDKPYSANRCGNCRRCLDACPNGALMAERTINTGKCIARLTNQKTEIEADPSRLNGWVFGCDECQMCCPYNAKTPASSGVMKPVADIPAVNIGQLTDGEFRQFFKKTPLEFIGVDMIKKRISKVSGD